MITPYRRHSEECKHGDLSRDGLCRSRRMPTRRQGRGGECRWYGEDGANAFYDNPVLPPHQENTGVRTQDKAAMDARLQVKSFVS